ncbi:MAG: hypothetical protein JSU90_02750 [Nitrospiraceae bacterium]|nr:MAG: hypothetical protein JSU90_02750 [Nitrospiraceae bacterium]
MKKLFIALAIVSVFAAAAVAFAHGPGAWAGGQMMGPGYGGHMTGMGYGHMGGWMSQGYGTGKTDQKFLDETADVRKDLHNKRFEYFEAQRDPKTTNETLAKLEKEMNELQEKLYEKSPRTAHRGYGAYGRCF